MSLDPDYKYTKDELDNHADQLNPTSDVYESSRAEAEPIKKKTKASSEKDQ